jgi:hypothetical protein
MAREITGAEWRTFITQPHDNLSDALQEAANVAAGIELLQGGFIRVIHQYDVETGMHDILLVVEVS